jgi:four helix bundle protein
LSYGSAYELETQLIIANNLDLQDEQENKKLCEEVDELQKMIYVFSKNLKTR